MRRSKAQVVCAIVLASCVWTAVPDLARLTQLAWDLAPLSERARRERVLGRFYSSLREVARELPAGAPVAVILIEPREIDRAVFINYYLYPAHDTRWYFGWETYRTGRSAGRPEILLRTDVERDEVARASFDDLRRAQVRTKRLAHDMQPPAIALRQFVVPLVGAAEGSPPDLYTTEVMFVADRRSRVTMTFEPFGERRTIVLQPNRPVIIHDLVQEMFGHLSVGWLDVSATEPVRAAFWFANAGRKKITPLTVFPALPPLPQRVTGGERLWVLNRGHQPVKVLINGQAHDLPARGFLALPAGAETLVDGRGAVFAFTSRKLPDGNTVFIWPEHNR